jgi:hypothetical protein
LAAGDVGVELGLELGVDVAGVFLGQRLAGCRAVLIACVGVAFLALTLTSFTTLESFLALMGRELGLPSEPDACFLCPAATFAVR